MVKVYHDSGPLRQSGITLLMSNGPLDVGPGALFAALLASRVAWSLWKLRET